MKKRKDKLFLDANVFIAAILSPTGGSSRLINEAFRHGFQLFSSQYAIAEAMINIARKYPECSSDFKDLLLSQPVKIAAEPTQKFIQKAKLLINVKDVPILACVMESKMDFLITLDKSHFFNSKIKSEKLPCEILIPGDFIKKYLND